MDRFVVFRVAFWATSRTLYADFSAHHPCHRKLQLAKTSKKQINCCGGERGKNLTRNSNMTTAITTAVN